MRTAVATLRSIAPYSQSRGLPIDGELRRRDKETAHDHEERTWRARIHADAAGQVFIPPMAFKNALSEIAKFLGMQIPGKGKSTYTKHFEAGVLCMTPLVLPLKRDDVQCEWLFVPSDGIRGSGKRVWKCFPVIQEWTGEAVFQIIDDTITDDVFEHHLREAGSFIGIGRFRPRNNGFYGRFAVEEVAWS